MTNMKLITEVNQDIEIVTEELNEGKEKNLYIKGIFLQSAIQNRNGRVYPEEIMDNEVGRYINESIDKKRAMGELGHPSGPSINLDKVSHIITELKKIGTNWHGVAKITNTPMGDIAKGLIESGVSLGVSSRGMGSIKSNSKGINEVQNDFKLATAADIVADPSAPDAFVNGIMEGVEWVWKNNVLVAEKIEEEIEQVVASRTLNENAKLKLFRKYVNSI